MALDALEMAFTHQHINAYVIVGGDSDFLSLVEKLKQYDKKVFVVGGRAFTSIILQRNCHEFIAYENLSGVRRAASAAASGTANKGGRPATPIAVSPMAQAFPIVRRALKILADREVSPQTGLLKSTLLQLDSTFSERNYGASSFLDFAEKLAHAGLVHLKTSGRSVMVELNPQFEEGERPADQQPRETIASEPPAVGRRGPAGPADVGAAARRSAADAGARGDRIGRRWRQVRRRRAAEGHQRAVADVHPQREAVAARRRQQLRRAPVRLWRVDGSAARLPARRA